MIPVIRIINEFPINSNGKVDINKLKEEIQLKDKIIDIIVKACGDESVRSNLDVDLIEKDMLDSLALINLISMLEDEFDIEIQPTTINPNTWKSVNKIIDLVENIKGE